MITDLYHSLYKVLCFTEIWLTKDHDDECYFPQKFTVLGKIEKHMEVV